MRISTLGFTTRFASAATVCCLIFAAAGCNKSKPDTTNFKTAINNYYSVHPSCVWQSAVKFPAQADAGSDTQTKGFDALTDAGLLTRTPQEKKRFLIGSKQVNDYDISDKGRTQWTADTSQPGYGNFCYGHREVTSIDSSTPGTNGSGAKTATVTYHYKIADVPSWANAAEVKTAFPNVADALNSNPTDTATLVQTGDRWEYTQ